MSCQACEPQGGGTYFILLGLWESEDPGVTWCTPSLQTSMMKQIYNIARAWVCGVGSGERWTGGRQTLDRALGEARPPLLNSYTLLAPLLTDACQEEFESEDHITLRSPHVAPLLSPVNNVQGTKLGRRCYVFLAGRQQEWQHSIRVLSQGRGVNLYNYHR